MEYNFLKSKKRILMIFSLLIISLSLSGCGWNDVTKKYSSLLSENNGSGVVCKYKKTSNVVNGSSKVDPGFDVLIFKAGSNDGITLDLDNNKYVFISPTQTLKTDFIYNTYGISFKEKDIYNYLDSFNSTDQCLKNIGFQKDGEYKFVFKTTCTRSCRVYELDNSSSSGSYGTTDSSCHYTNATKCVTVARGDASGTPWYLEIGKYGTGEGAGYYFAVATNSKFDNKAVSTTKNKSISELAVTKKYDNGSDSWNVRFELVSAGFLSDDFLDMDDDKAPVYLYSNNNDQNYTVSMEEMNDGSHTIVGIIDGDNSGVIPAPDDYFDINNESENIDYSTLCSSLLGETSNSEDPAYWLNIVLIVLRYIAIIALLVLSSYDFIKAIISQDGDALKKATNHLWKRLIFCVIIFFVPTIVKFVLTTLGIENSCDLTQLP
jgi:hypothetical protein